MTKHEYFLLKVAFIALFLGLVSSQTCPSPCASCSGSICLTCNPGFYLYTPLNKLLPLLPLKLLNLHHQQKHLRLLLSRLLLLLQHHLFLLPLVLPDLYFQVQLQQLRCGADAEVGLVLHLFGYELSGV